MTENTGDDGRRQLDRRRSTTRCSKHYPYTDKLIDSFIAHTHADQKLGHENVFLEMCESVPPLTRREVKDALNVVALDGRAPDAVHGRHRRASTRSFPTVPRAAL